MTDTEIITKVLESCGWRLTGVDQLGTEPTINIWTKGLNFGQFAEFKDTGQLLTSLDACHDVFEKDATIIYWNYLIDEVDDSIFNYVKAAKATPRQRCLAWLKFKGINI